MNSDNVDGLSLLRDKLNAIINNHNYLTEEIKEITNVSNYRLLNILEINRSFRECVI